LSLLKKKQIVTVNIIMCVYTLLKIITDTKLNIKYRNITIFMEQVVVNKLFYLTNDKLLYVEI